MRCSWHIAQNSDNKLDARILSERYIVVLAQLAELFTEAGQNAVCMCVCVCMSGC